MGVTALVLFTFIPWKCYVPFNLLAIKKGRAVHDFFLFPPFFPAVRHKNRIGRIIFVKIEVVRSEFFISEKRANFRTSLRSDKFLTFENVGAFLVPLHSNQQGRQGLSRER